MTKQNRFFTLFALALIAMSDVVYGANKKKVDPNAQLIELRRLATQYQANPTNYALKHALAEAYEAAMGYNSDGTGGGTGGQKTAAQTIMRTVAKLDEKAAQKLVEDERTYRYSKQAKADLTKARMSLGVVTKSLGDWKRKYDKETKRLKQASEDSLRKRIELQQKRIGKLLKRLDTTKSTLDSTQTALKGELARARTELVTAQTSLESAQASLSVHSLNLATEKKAVSLLSNIAYLWSGLTNEGIHEDEVKKLANQVKPLYGKFNTIIKGDPTKVDEQLALLQEEVTNLVKELNSVLPDSPTAVYSKGLQEIVTGADDLLDMLLTSLIDTYLIEPAAVPEGLEDRKNEINEKAEALVKQVRKFDAEVLKPTLASTFLVAPDIDLKRDAAYLQELIKGLTPLKEVIAYIARVAVGKADALGGGKSKEEKLKAAATYDTGGIAYQAYNQSETYYETIWSLGDQCNELRRLASLADFNKAKEMFERALGDAVQNKLSDADKQFFNKKLAEIEEALKAKEAADKEAADKEAAAKKEDKPKTEVTNKDEPKTPTFPSKTEPQLPPQSDSQKPSKQLGDPSSSVEVPSKIDAATSPILKELSSIPDIAKTGLLDLALTGDVEKDGKIVASKGVVFMNAINVIVSSKTQVTSELTRYLGFVATYLPSNDDKSKASETIAEMDIIE